MEKVHITLIQELHAVVLLLCRMPFHLSGKMIVLYLGNSTAKAYLCNQGCMVLFSFQTGLLHIEPGQQAWLYSYSSVHTYPSPC